MLKRHDPGGVERVKVKAKSSGAGDNFFIRLAVLKFTALNEAVQFFKRGFRRGYGFHGGAGSKEARECGGNDGGVFH